MPAGLEPRGCGGHNALWKLQAAWVPWEHTPEVLRESRPSTFCLGATWGGLIRVRTCTLTRKTKSGAFLRPMGHVFRPFYYQHRSDVQLAGSALGQTLIGIATHPIGSGARTGAMPAPLSPRHRIRSLTLVYGSGRVTDADPACSTDRLYDISFTAVPEINAAIPPGDCARARSFSRIYAGVGPA
jgi:hypothetical protein